MSFLHGVEVLELDSGPRPIRIAPTSVIGIVGTAPNADESAFPLNTPTLIAGSRLEAAKLDLSDQKLGTLPNALDGILDQAGAVVIVVRIEEGATEAETLANVIGGVNAETGAFEGVQALLGAQSVVGFSPRLLIAPGFTHQRLEDGDNPGKFFANPVVAELQGIAERLRAVIIADGPNTKDETAIEYSEDFGSARVYLVDPWVKVLGPDGKLIDEPPSARVAGLISKIDNERGFWWSPSNQLLNGIIGTTRPVDFKMGDRSCRANLLNAKNVATIIREDGFRLWGNRTLSSDLKWAFLCQRRTADIINDALQASHLWAIDRAITKTYYDDVVEGVNNFLSGLKARGAILGGQCWAPPELNRPADIADGKATFDFDFTSPSPAEHITFRSRMVNDYLEELF
jgi:phage tail sheath protein FI